MLLDNKASVHLCSPASGPEAALPLHHAVLSGNADIACCLLRAGADPMAEDGKGWSVLARAHQSNDMAMLQCIRDAATLRTAGCTEGQSTKAPVPSGLFLDSDTGDHEGTDDASELSGGISSDDSDGFVVGTS